METTARVPVSATARSEVRMSARRDVAECHGSIGPDPEVLWRGAHRLECRFVVPLLALGEDADDFDPRARQRELERGPADAAEP